MTRTGAEQTRPRSVAIRRRAMLSGMVTMSAVAMVACLPDRQEEDDVKLHTDDELDESILRIWEYGGEEPLAAILETDFEELMVFTEGTSAQRVNEAAGFRLVTEKRYLSSTQLFLLRSGGEAVDALMVSADVFEHRGAQSSYGAAVRLIGEGSRQLLRLED